MEMMIQSTDLTDLEVEASDLEFRTVEETDEDGYEFKRIGFFKKGTNKLYGPARQIWQGLDIQEGMWKDDSLQGYGRECWWSGGYYQGTWKDDNYHGQGRHVNAEGGIEEGRFVDGELVE